MEMQDFAGEGDQVSEVDPLDVSASTDNADSLLGSVRSNESSSFSGFIKISSASEHKKMPQQKTKKASSSSHKEKRDQPSTSKQTHNDARSSKDSKKASKGSHKADAKSRVGASQLERRSPSPIPQTSTHSAPVATSSGSLPQLDMLALVSAIM